MPKALFVRLPDARGFDASSVQLAGAEVADFHVVVAGERVDAAAVMSFIRHWNTVERRPFRWRFRGEFAPRLPWAA